VLWSQFTYCLSFTERVLCVPGASMYIYIYIYIFNLDCSIIIQRSFRFKICIRCTGATYAHDTFTFLCQHLRWGNSCRRQCARVKQVEEISMSAKIHRESALYHYGLQTILHKHFILAFVCQPISGRSPTGSQLGALGAKRRLT
jgi:hypothetical protein